LPALKITAIKPYAIATPVTDWTFVKVETDDSSIFGWGECSLPGKPHGVLGALRDLQKLVLDHDPLNSEFLWQRMYRHGYWRGGPIQTSAMSGIDVALWDIRGKVWRQPLHKLLGGAVRTKVKLYANIGLSCDADEFRRRGEIALAMGYRGVKIYPLPPVGPVEGPAVLRQVAGCCGAIRDLLGRDRDFAVDMHGRCSAGLATQIEAMIRDTSPMWIEEPVPAEQPHSLRRLAEKSVIPLAGGERLFTRWGFKQILDEQLLDIIQPDVSNAGGVSEMAKLASLAELHGVAFSPHNPNGPVQSLTSLHLAAHASTGQWLEHRHEHHAFMKKICPSFPQVGADGYCTLPDWPGIGADVDEAFLQSNPAVDWTPEVFREDGSPGDW
jgi:galactonate dehydratase